MKKTIRDFDLNDKKVIIRVDFNVPIVDGIITDDNRIKQSLPTINYALEHGAKIILLSHLGRIKEPKDCILNTLEPVALRLSELLDKEIIFVDETVGELVENEINNMKKGDIILLENTRFEDLEDKKESSNNTELGLYWAKLGDIFINDAFATSHRSHASNVGIASHLPSGIGLLVEKELNMLNVENASHPLTIILGGSKVKDKINLTQNLVNLADYILIGGGMAFTFLKSQEIEIGNSILDEENISFCKKLLNEHKDKIILPTDVVVKDENGNIRTCFITDIKENERGLDIGHSTIKLFKTFLEDSKTIIWNGPLGMFEEKPFANGTNELCKIFETIDAKVIVGGGDTGACLKQLHLENTVEYISTGGGASLELLEGKKLPAIEVIDEK